MKQASVYSIMLALSLHLPLTLSIFTSTINWYFLLLFDLKRAQESDKINR